MNEVVVTADGLIRWSDRVTCCVLGSGGIRTDKQEGDKVTPAGRFLLRRVFFRADRVAVPATRLPTSMITTADGWCDESSDARYNCHVRLPYPARHELLWRCDATYDLLAVIGYNDDPVIPGKGSAIFLHLLQSDGRSTAGCIALAYEDLRDLLDYCSLTTSLVIKNTRD